MSMRLAIAGIRGLGLVVGSVAVLMILFNDSQMPSR
jgi:hypothetical protein